MNSHFRSYILMSGLHPPKKSHGSSQLACTCQMAQLWIPLIHTLLKLDLVQDIAICHSKHSFGFSVCVPMSLASFG